MELAIDCGDPTENLTITFHTYNSGSPPSLTGYRSTYVIVCEEGLIYVDFTYFNRINCTSSGKWTWVPDCTGIL